MRGEDVEADSQTYEKRQWYDASVSGPLVGDEQEDFLMGPRSPWLIKVTTLKEAGWPFTVPLWYHWDGESFWTVTRKRSDWIADVRRDPRSSICIEEREIPPGGKRESPRPDRCGGRRRTLRRRRILVASDCGENGPPLRRPRRTRSSLSFLRMGALPGQIHAEGWEADYLPGRRLASTLLRSWAAARSGGAGREGEGARLRNLVTNFAHRAVSARRSAIREVFDAASQKPVAIRLEIGEPSFTTPEHIIAGAIDAARAGFTGYTPNGGFLSLREAIADKIERVDGFRASSDEIVVMPGAMNEMVLDDSPEFVAAASLDPGERVISVYSFSKVYAMTGWRVGYCVARWDLADLLRKLQEPEVSCPSAISQKAAEAALHGPRGPITAMKDAYRERRDHAWSLVETRGLRAFRTQGTFHMLLDI